MLIIPGCTSERGGRSGVRNTRIHVRGRRKKWCYEYLDSRQREVEEMVLWNTRIHVRERRKKWC